jgi:D-lyxose ketol-isomerase
MKTIITILTSLLILVSCTSKSDNSSADNSTADKENCLESLSFANEDFYGEQGEFLLEKAKDATIALMEFHAYPVYEGIRDKLWISDYGTGRFTELGLAAVMFWNHEQDKYMLQDMFLLPNQMLPEHWHLDAEELPAKREGWLVRHGSSYIVGIGEDNLSDFPDVVIPAVHMDGEATTKHVILTDAGTFVPLAEVYTRHWQFGGPEGAIITEVANVHSGPSVRHSDEAINAQFLGL